MFISKKEYETLRRRVTRLQKQVDTLFELSQFGYGRYSTFGWEYRTELKTVVADILSHLGLEYKRVDYRKGKDVLTKKKKQVKKSKSKEQK